MALDFFLLSTTPAKTPPLQSNGNGEDMQVYIFQFQESIAEELFIIMLFTIQQ